VPDFSVDDLVVTVKEVRAGYSEDGPFICMQGTPGRVLEIDLREWDGINVELENGTTWWFKPSQLTRKDYTTQCKFDQVVVYYM
jgi:hypothetical protein